MNFTKFFQNISDDVNADVKVLLEIKNDCSTGHDGIPIQYLTMQCNTKPVTKDVTSPLVHIINTCIDNEVSHQPGK